MSKKLTADQPLSQTKESFGRLVEIIAALRHPQTGCPWDLEQTHETLRPFIVEETYEVLEAIEKNDDVELCSELGDVLLQVVLHAQLATDRGAFGIDDVVNKITQKMIRRHPHVFGEAQVSGSKDVLRNWEQIKKEERKEAAVNDGDGFAKSILAGVPSAMPALLRSHRLGEKAAKVGFDWPDTESVMAKVQEETAELQVELKTQSTKENLAAVKHELGDLLFAVAQLARKLGLSAEDCLHACSARFTERFSEMESSSSRSLAELSLEKLDEAWEQAKRRLNKSS